MFFYVKYRTSVLFWSHYDSTHTVFKLISVLSCYFRYIKCQINAIMIDLNIAKFSDSVNDFFYNNI